MEIRLKEVRESMNDTQESLAKKLGVGSGSISSWENDYSDIPLRRLLAISNMSGYSIDYIMNLREYNINYTKLDKLDKKTIADNLRKLKKSYNLTQKDMASIATISEDTYSLYERAINTITTMSLYSICKKFNVSMDEMLGRKIP